MSQWTLTQIHDFVKSYEWVKAFCNINWIDVNVDNVDGSSLRAPCQNGQYENKHIEQHETQRTARRKRHSEHTIVVCFGLSSVRTLTKLRAKARSTCLLMNIVPFLYTVQ